MRRWLRLAVVGGAIVALAATGVILTRSPIQAATCTDLWISGSGNFNTPASWSTGAVPTSADDACITATTITNPPAPADVYNVTLDGSVSVHSLTIGGPNGTQTLLIPASGAQLTLSAASTIGSNGVLTMGDAGTASSYLCCAGVNLTNLGNINTVTGGGGNRVMRLNVINAASGTIVIGGATVFDDGGGGATTITNNGSIAITTGILALGGTIPSTFINSGGSVANSSSFYIQPGTFVQRAGTETGNPVLLANGSTLDDDLNAGAGNFQFRTGAQTLTGTGSNPGVAAGQVLTVQSDNSQTSVARDMTNAGTINLGQAATGTSSLCCAGVTLTNAGHLNAVTGGGGNHYLRLNLINASSGTVDIAGPTSQDGGGGGATATTNNGTITLEKGQTLALAGGSTFAQGGGGTFATTIDANATTFGQLTGGGGSVSLNGQLKVTTVGSPATGSSWPIISGANRAGQFSSLDFGLLNYAVQYPATGVTLVAQAPCDYWIGGNGNFNTASNWSMGAVPNTAYDACITQTTSSTPPAAADTYTVLVDSNLVAIGTLQLGGATGTQTLQVAGNSSEFLINTTGTINSNGVLLLGDSNVASGYSWLATGGPSSLLTNNGILRTVQGGGGSRLIRINLTNAATGTVDIAAADTRQDGASPTTTTNNGTFTVESGASFAISAFGNTFANTGGTVTNNGTFRETGNTFTQRGGAESGNPILLQGVILDDDLSAGAAKFVLSGGDITGTGSQPGVATGQVVTLAGDSTRIVLDKSLTNAGTITLGDAGTGYSWLAMGTNTFVLTNAGHLNTVTGGGGIRYLRLNITNAAAGTVDLAAPDSRQDFSAASTINNGVFIIEPGSIFYLSGGSAFTQGAGGTFQTTIDANATKFGQLNGGGDAVTIDGTVKVVTVGHPAVGSSWPIIATANRTGTFPGHDFGSWNYTVQYPATGVTLVAQGTCDVWIGGVDNKFGTAGNWSLGLVPTSTDDVCINATTTTTPPATADTYTVLVNGDFPVNSLTLGGPNGTQTLDIQSGSRLTLLSGSSINARGVLVLGDSGSGDAWLGCVPNCSPTGPTLTNNGTLKTVQGGGGTRHIQTMVINAAGATLDIAGTAVQTDAGCNNPGGIGQNKAVINNGTVIVKAAGNFSPDCGFVNSAGATVVNNGTLTPGGAFVQRGTESGNPVLFMNGSGIDDDLSAGPGSFVYSGSAGYPSGQNSLGGSGPNPGIPAGQTITIASTNTYIGIYPNITNAGTIILGDSSGTGDGALCCSYFTALPTITNTGTIRTVQGSGGIRHLQVNVANAAGGTIDIAADTRQDQACGAGGVNATTITNAGTFTIEATGRYAMSTCAAGGHQNTFTQGAGGTFQTTVDATANKFGQLTGGAVNLDGNLRVTTVGWPGLDSTWPIISGANRLGTFATFDICGPDYNVEYAASSVTLAVRVRLYTTQSTTQETLSNSNGSTWWDMDPGQLSLTFIPSADSYAVLSGNADLWTSVAGYNQDLGISVSGGIYPTVAGQPEAWKESGGYAGTFSPNAAFVQTVVFLKQGQPYTVKLVWKANKNAPGATIWAGAGPIGVKFSPTRLTAHLLPASTSNLKSATVTDQPRQSGSDGATWKDLDAGLSFQYTPCVNGQARLSGNVDLWTSVAGYNQDVGISVTGSNYPSTAGQPEVWKESGGNAGTFSPNAAFVQGVIPLSANTTYTFRLTWKTNRPSPASGAIWAGAGPIGSQYSPTRLMLQFIPSGGSVSRVVDVQSTAQYSQSGSDGATWVDMDVSSATPLTFQLSSTTSCVAVLSANADLWTTVAGYNQDIGITVSGGAYPTTPGQPEAWKESGGFAGTQSPNAAYVQTVLQLAPGVPYTVKVQWKANIRSPSTAAIYTGAGAINAKYSPTRLTALLLGCS